MITPETPDWDSDDSANFRAFLKTRTGERLLPRLLEFVPRLLASGDINAILIRSGEVRGFSSAARELLTLAFPDTEQKITDIISNYPALEDEAAWAEQTKPQ